MRSNHERPLAHEASAIGTTLATSTVSLSGAMVDLTGDTWTIPAGPNQSAAIHINWRTLASDGVRTRLSSGAISLGKRWIAHQISRRSGRTVANYLAALRMFDRWLCTAQDGVLTGGGFEWSMMTEHTARRYTLWLARNVTAGGQAFYNLRSFYEWAVHSGESQFDAGILVALNQITMQDHASGHHVRAAHPTKGPFSADEVLLIRRALQAGTGTPHQRIVVMLHLELGHNSSGSVLALARDFRMYHSSGGAKAYHLDVPVAKRRGRAPTKSTKRLTETLGALLAAHLPEDGESPLLSWIPRGNPNGSLTQIMQRWARDAGLVSPRTKAFLNLTPRRFRSTLATEIVAQGGTGQQVRAALNHRGARSAALYIETRATIAYRVADATDTALRPWVDRFLGRVTDHADDLPSSRIPARAPHLPLPVLNVEFIGGCGRSDGPCNLYPPLSCYSCPKFVALSSAPHQELVDSVDSFIAASEESGDPRPRHALRDFTEAAKQLIAQINAEHRAASEAV